MDAEGFDRLAKVVGRDTSRRPVLAGLIGATLAGLRGRGVGAAGSGVASAACQPTCDPCNGDRHCCSGRCRAGICRCKRRGSCTSNRACCSGHCRTNGRCKPAPPKPCDPPGCEQCTGDLCCDDINTCCNAQVNSACCELGQICCTSGSGDDAYCCAGQQSCCSAEIGTTCCDADQICCTGTGQALCCSAGQTCCPNGVLASCCEAGQTCNNGACQ